MYLANLGYNQFHGLPNPLVPVRKRCAPMTRNDLLQILTDIIDAACWDARSYGHDDNGLEDSVDIDGVDVPFDDEEYGYHRSAVAAATEITDLVYAWVSE